MKTSSEKKQQIEILRKTATDLYKSGKTIREVGNILSRSHTWVWFALGNKQSRSPKKKRTERQSFTAFNLSALKKYPGERITFEEWTDYTKDWDKICFCCGDKRPYDGLLIDHIIHASKGGKHELSNLQVLCRKCNSRKGTKSWDFRGNIKMFTSD